jgi:head-tail adaptor
MSGAELAGLLRERVDILRRAATRDDLGGASGDWMRLASVWAQIVPDGDGPVDGDWPDGPARWLATLRSAALVRAGDRLGWRDRLLKVRSVIADPATPDRLALTLEDAR